MPPEIMDFLKDIEMALNHIVEDVEGIIFEEFVSKRQLRQAVERNFEIIGYDDMMRWFSTRFEMAGVSLISGMSLHMDMIP